MYNFSLLTFFYNCIKHIRNMYRLPCKKDSLLCKRKKSAINAICVKSILHSKIKLLNDLFSNNILYN